MAIKGEDMADKMEYPKTMREFIDNYSFNDIEEVYTNGVELVPVFRIEQALYHYEKEIRKKIIDDFAKALTTMYEKYDIDDVFESSDTYSYTSACYIFEHYIYEIAEQLKAGG